MTELEFKNITLSESERQWFKKKNNNDLKFLYPDIFKNLIEKECIRRQFIPLISELKEISEYTTDPQQEEKHTVSSFLIHRYKNRVAFTVTDKCFAYCRHCFRRRFTSSSRSITDKELEEACSYISLHKEITEILITGGDPLTLSNEKLETILTEVRKANKNIIIRLCTRALCVKPERFDKDVIFLLNKFNKDAPLFVLTQFNTPFELTDEAKIKAEEISKNGIYIFNQSVLLKGVNDDVKMLSHLCTTLLRHRIKPYYIFQCDDVKGTEHFHVSDKKALMIEKELREELSGLSMPQFIKDRSKGEGKIPLFEYVYSL